MKLHEVRKKYKFNQNTFYTWMREANLIEKIDEGYIIGSDALAGMKTLQTPFLDKSTGEVKDSCQVTIDDEQIELLVELYLNSGLSKLYSSSKSDDGRDDLDELRDRIEILENQINILNIQIRQLMK